MDQHVTGREFASLACIALKILLVDRSRLWCHPWMVSLSWVPVYHAVLGMVVGQIIRPTLGIKEGPLQDAHARKFEFVPGRWTAG